MNPDLELREFIFEYINKYTNQVIDDGYKISLYEVAEKITPKIDKFIDDIKNEIQKNTLMRENKITKEDLINNNKLINSSNVNLLQDTSKTSSICIICYKNDKIGNWCPDSVNVGLPGSEEAVIHLSNELAKLNYKVDIYCSPEKGCEHSKLNSNPRWLDLLLYHERKNTNFYDLAILWRNTDLKYAKLRSKKAFCWLHDSIGHNLNVQSKFDYYLLLSEFHAKQFKEVSKQNYVIIGNGVNLEDFPLPSAEKIKNSIGYFSNYSRGLEILIMIWPDLKLKYPDASLHIYYGRETWGTMNDNHLKYICDKIQTLDGIHEYGMVSHKKLHEAMSTLSIWAYPCINESETFCITAIKAQLSGMIPVVNKIGALEETVLSQYSTNYKERNLNTNEDFISDYGSKLYDALDFQIDTSNDVNKLRSEYIEFAKKYEWRISCEKLNNII
jgi:hypothetical protein